MAKKIIAVILFFYALAQIISFLKYQSVPQLFWGFLAILGGIYLFKKSKPGNDSQK